MRISAFKYLAAFTWLLSALLVGHTRATAQNGGSGYSRYGLGDLQYASTSSRMAVGGAGIAVLNTNNAIDPLNPAGWTKINRTGFYVGAEYEGISTRDQAKSAYLSSTSFDGFMVAWPVSVKSGVVLGAGFTPLSRVNYNVITPASSGIYDYNVQYAGDGGLSLGYAGLSATLAEDFNLGAKINYYFGTLNYTTKQLFAGGAYTNSELKRSLELRGLGITIGGVYTGLNKYLGLGPASSLNMGFIFSTSSNLSVNEERDYIFNTSGIVTLDTVLSAAGKMNLPFSLGGGISYTKDRLLFAADIFFQNWENFSDNGTHPTEIRNSYRIGTGIELLPRRETSARFSQRVAYRVGFFYDASYYRLKGEPINELGLTGGFGIPIFGETRIAIGAEYAFRGTTNKNLQKDKILRISLTLNGSELWFVRPEQE